MTGQWATHFHNKGALTLDQGTKIGMHGARCSVRLNARHFLILVHCSNVVGAYLPLLAPDDATQLLMSWWLGLDANSLHPRTSKDVPKAAKSGLNISESGASLCHAHCFVSPSAPASAVDPPLCRQGPLQKPA